MPMNSTHPVFTQNNEHKNQVEDPLIGFSIGQAFASHDEEYFYRDEF